jgi:hypothetical protein
MRHALVLAGATFQVVSSAMRRRVRGCATTPVSLARGTGRGEALRQAKAAPAAPACAVRSLLLAAFNRAGDWRPSSMLAGGVSHAVHCCVQPGRRLATIVAMLAGGVSHAGALLRSTGQATGDDRRDACRRGIARGCTAAFIPAGDWRPSSRSGR